MSLGPNTKGLWMSSPGGCQSYLFSRLVFCFACLYVYIYIYIYITLELLGILLLCESSHDNLCSCALLGLCLHNT